MRRHGERFRCGAHARHRIELVAGPGPPSRRAVAVAGVTALAFAHQQIDLATYLLGGAHAHSSNLFTVTLPADNLGFTYPPFSALLFAPFAHLPLRVCEVGFSWLNLAGVFALLVVSLRAVCASFDRRTIMWWSLALLVPVLLFDPVRQTFLLGQINILLAVIVAADMTLDLPIPRGILVGLAAAIKVTPIILIPYLFLTRQGRVRLQGHRVVLRGRPRRHPGVPVQLVELLDPLHPGPATGRHALVGRQPGFARGDRTGPRAHRHHADDVPHRGDHGGGRTARGGRGLPALVAGPRLPGGRGHGVAGQPGFLVAPLHLGRAPRGLAGPGRRPAPLRRVVRPGRIRAVLGCALLVGAPWPRDHLRREGLAHPRLGCLRHPLPRVDRRLGRAGRTAARSNGRWCAVGAWPPRAPAPERPWSGPTAVPRVRRSTVRRPGPRGKSPVPASPGATTRCG